MCDFIITQFDKIEQKHSTCKAFYFVTIVQTLIINDKQ